MQQWGITRATRKISKSKKQYDIIPFPKKKKNDTNTQTFNHTKLDDLQDSIGNVSKINKKNELRILKGYKDHTLKKSESAPVDLYFSKIDFHCTLLKNKKPVFSIMIFSLFPRIPLIFNINHQSMNNPEEKSSKSITKF